MRRNETNPSPCPSLRGRGIANNMTMRTEAELDVVTVILPDGSRKEVDRSATAYDVAAGISGGLARAAIAAEVDGELRDLHAPLMELRTAEADPRQVRVRII